jgi:hypothetical protein
MNKRLNKRLDLKRLIGTLSLFVVSWITGLADAGVITLSSRIDGAQANGGVGTGSPATGYARLTYDDVSRLLTWEINWEGLEGTVTNMHFHGPAAAGTSAGVAVTITDQESPSVGTATLTEAQAADLLNGLYYINIHTSVQGGGEIRGQVLLPLVSLDSTALDEGPLATWSNSGSTGGDFVAEFDTPEVATVDGVKGVVFDGAGDWYVGPAAPESVTGASSRTVVAWVNNEAIAGEETVFAWGMRNGPNGTNTSFNHGSNGDFGAVGHWGAPDLGWNGTQVAGEWTMIAYSWNSETQTTNVYTNGKLANTEAGINLNTHAVDTSVTPLPFVVGNQNEPDGSHTDALSATMAIARIRAYAEVLAPEQILGDFLAEAADFGIELPFIASFKATPAKFGSGATVTLSWDVPDAETLSIEPGIGEVTGMTSVEVMPTGNTTYILTATAGASTSTREVTVELNSEPALIHRWSFDETGEAGTALIDSVGGAHGTIVDNGANDGTVADGQVTLTGGAKDVSDYVEFPSGLLEGLTSVTLELWATEHSVQNWSRVFSFGPGDGTQTDTFMLAWSRGTEQNTQRLEKQGIGAADSNLPTELDEQYHFVAIWDEIGGVAGDGEYRWYRDGELAAAFPTNGATLDAVNDSVLWLGRSQWGDNTADASWNDFMVYDGALTEAQVQAHFEAGVQPSIIHRWGFNESGGAGTALLDTVGGQDGTIVDQGDNDGVVGGGSVTLAGGAKAATDYVQFPSGLLEGLESVTIETWATEHSVQNWSRVFSFGGGDITTNAWHLAWSRGIEQNTQRFEKEAVGPADSNEIVELDQEYHIVAIWDATGGGGEDGEYRWYRDGQLMASLETGGVGLDIVDDTVLWLGRSQWGDNTANASWREMRMYNGVLSESYFHGRLPASADVNPDTDGDGIPDDFELTKAFLDPNNPADALLDQDNDGLSNVAEFNGGLDMEKPDTDGDGVTDGAEVNRMAGGSPAATDPKKPDTDGDGVSDGDEINRMANGTAAPTDPLLVDTDGDGFSDGTERDGGSDPLDIASLPTPVYPNLLHRWSFEETGAGGTVLTDSVGEAHGTIVDLDAGEDFAGSVGGGQVTLSGGGSAEAAYVEFPSDLLQGLSSVTVETWATEHSVQNWSRVFSFGSGAGETDAFHLAWSRGTEQNTQRFEKQLVGPADSDLPVELDREYHIVAMWDGEGGDAGDGQYRWYRDGELAASINTNGVGLDTVDDTVLWLGRSQWAADSTANASWNEVRIYDGTLSELAIAANGVAGPDSAPGVGTSATFAITDVSIDAVGAVTLTWISRPGVTYGVERSDDLQAQSWEEVTDSEESQGELSSFTDAGLPAGTKVKYYRVVEAP